MELLPVLPPSNTIIKLAKTIVKAKKRNPAIDTTETESKIDYLVYHLYGLTYDEVLIIDPQTPITRDEYESEIS